MRYIWLILYFTFFSSSSICQSVGLFQLNGLVVDRSNFVGATSFRQLDFNNNCLIVQSGLNVFRTKRSDVPLYYPCADTKEVIRLKLTIFPNPSPHIITVKTYFLKNLQRFCFIRITDLLGRILITKHCRLIEIQQGLSFNVSNLSSGIYYVVIQGDDVFGFNQFVKISR